MITLGTQSFAGPFLLPLWSPPKGAGVYAVLVPGWRLQTFRALHFDHAEGLSIEKVKNHSRLAEWLSIAGTEWNLYVAVLEMSFSTDAQRQAAVRSLAREYKPEFTAAAGAAADLPSLRTLLLARALRAHEEQK
jgi:hypothetical protein